MADVKLTGVGKAYGDVKILKGIDLDIRDGEFMVFVGPRGRGKSALLRTIAGLEGISSTSSGSDDRRMRSASRRISGSLSPWARSIASSAKLTSRP